MLLYLPPVNSSFVNGWLLSCGMQMFSNLSAFLGYSNHLSAISLSCARFLALMSDSRDTMDWLSRIIAYTLVATVSAHQVGESENEQSTVSGMCWR